MKKCNVSVYFWTFTTFPLAILSYYSVLFFFRTHKAFFHLLHADACHSPVIMTTVIKDYTMSKMKCYHTPFSVKLHLILTKNQDSAELVMTYSFFVERKFPNPNQTTTDIDRSVNQ